MCSAVVVLPIGGLCRRQGPRRRAGFGPVAAWSSDLITAKVAAWCAGTVTSDSSRISDLRKRRPPVFSGSTVDRLEPDRDAADQLVEDRGPGAIDLVLQLPGRVDVRELRLERDAGRGRGKEARDADGRLALVVQEQREFARRTWRRGVRRRRRPVGLRRRGDPADLPRGRVDGFDRRGCVGALHGRATSCARG